MQFWKLEKRPINPRAVYVACMIGVTFGIPAVIIIPKVIEARTASEPPPGTPCIYNREVGQWQILENQGDSYVLRSYFLGGDNKLTVPKDQVTFSDRWVAEEYHWFFWFD